MRIEGTRLFRIVFSVTMESGATLVALTVQGGERTTLSDDAAGEWIKKTGAWVRGRPSRRRLLQMQRLH